ncbi:glycosyltransferase family 2 protein [Priestia aryabhattai]|uniref:glycosyltransferase family 2 protein n=1 Tax=Priestia aryabhattai TaxID=412384 RepID=UPI0035622A78
MKDLSFIIVNYNTKIITSDCIESINKNKTLANFNYEIIVVDNNSSDSSLEYFQKQNFDNVKLIKNEANKGFGQANNIGAINSDGKYLVLLNSDTIVDQTNFALLINTISKNMSIGVLSAKILNDNDTIQSLGFNFPSLRNDTKLNLLFWNYNFVKKFRYKKYKDRGVFKTDWVSGCFMIMRKSDYQSVNGFDENIFMYAEDVDLCLRLFKNKKYSYIHDHTFIYHLHGKSGDKKNIKLSQLLKRKENYYYVIKKNELFGSSKLFLIKLTYLINSLVVVAGKKFKSKIN